MVAVGIYHFSPLFTYTWPRALPVRTLIVKSHGVEYCGVAAARLSLGRNICNNMYRFNAPTPIKQPNGVGGELQLRHRIHQFITDIRVGLVVKLAVASQQNRPAPGSIVSYTP